MQPAPLPPGYEYRTDHASECQHVERVGDGPDPRTTAEGSVSQTNPVQEA